MPDIKLVEDGPRTWCIAVVPISGTGNDRISSVHVTIPIAHGNASKEEVMTAAQDWFSECFPKAGFTKP